MLKFYGKKKTNPATWVDQWSPTFTCFVVF